MYMVARLLRGGKNCLHLKLPEGLSSRLPNLFKHNLLKKIGSAAMTRLRCKALQFALTAPQRAK